MKFWNWLFGRKKEEAKRKRKILLLTLIPISFSLIFTGFMVFIYTGCSKKSPANVLDPSKSDWTKHFYTKTIGAFAPESTTGLDDEDTNGDFVGGWEEVREWLKTTNYDTLDLGAFSSVANYAFYDLDTSSGLLIDTPIEHVIFSGTNRTSIGESAFSLCTSLTSLSLPNSLTSIRNYAFSQCSSLVSITLPNSLTSIGIGTFSFCRSLISVKLPNSLTSINGGSFIGCFSLTSLTLPKSLTTIGENAFSNCTSLTSITASYDEEPSIGENTFSNGASSGTVENTGYISSRDFLEFLKGCGLPPTGWGTTS